MIQGQIGRSASLCHVLPYSSMLYSAVGFQIAAPCTPGCQQRQRNVSCLRSFSEVVVGVSVVNAPRYPRATQDVKLQSFIARSRQEGFSLGSSGADVRCRNVGGGLCTSIPIPFLLKKHHSRFFVRFVELEHTLRAWKITPKLKPIQRSLVLKPTWRIRTRGSRQKGCSYEMAPPVLSAVDV